MARVPKKTAPTLEDLDRRVTDLEHGRQTPVFPPLKPAVSQAELFPGLDEAVAAAPASAFRGIPKDGSATFRGCRR